MCTKNFFSIRGVNPASPSRAFVPCGVCEDCRAVIRNGWIFRLRLELDALVKKGWKIGFFTLTYDDSHLPHIPAWLFKDPADYCPLPCFSKSDVRSFLKSLKKWFLKDYDVRGIRYMICSEYGEHTQRPHYHGIVCFPSVVPAEVVHDKIKRLWYNKENPDILDSVTEKGFVYPFDFNGGSDGNGYEHKPFVCDCSKAAAVYAAKYVCKDLKFAEVIKDYDLFKCVNLFRSDVVKNIELVLDDVDLYNDWDLGVLLPMLSLKKHKYLDEKPLKVKLSDYMSFHMQSKSLGLTWLDSLNDSEKMALLTDGLKFTGESVFSRIPVYFRNKILFDPHYIVDEKTGKRLVRRKAKEFFKKNLDEIFRLKVNDVKRKIDDWKNSDYWRKLGASKEETDSFVQLAKLRSNSISSSGLASAYVAFFGVPHSQCFERLAPALCWFRRYYDFKYDGELLDLEFYNFIQYYFSGLLSFEARLSWAENEKKVFRNRLLAKCRDFHINPKK